jgi:phage terminase large subunit-like protein
MRATVTKRGPKPALTGVLDLSGLPVGGPERVIGFVESFCRLVKGKQARQRVRLRPFQREIIEGLFGVRRPRRAYVQMPRKNGKSFLAACIGLYALVGDGEEGAEVYCAAGDEAQARVVWNLAKRIVEVGPLAGVVQIYADQLVHADSGSVMVPLSSDADLRQGLNPSLTIFDEVHVQPNADLWEAYDEAMGARARPLLLGITTPGADLESHAHALYEFGRTENDPDFYFRAFEPSDPDCAVDDEAAWAEANPGLGDWLSIDDMRSKCRRAQKLEREPTFRRFSMGTWTDEAESWIPRAVWEACASSRTSTPDVDVVLALDGSFSQDATVVVGCTVEETPHVWLEAIWENPNPGDDTYRIPVIEVEDTIREACKRRNVLELTADPYRWQRSLAVLGDEGIPVSEFPQSPSRMTPATTSLAEAAANQTLTHSGDAALARHVAHAVLKVDSRGTRLQKEHRNSHRRIDAAVAACMAFSRARDLASRPEPSITWIG